MAKLSTSDRKNLPKQDNANAPVAPGVKTAIKKKFPSMGQGGGLKGFLAKKKMV